MTEGARRDRVLAVALEAFGRHGFRKTSMEDVARAAGISRQGLYLQFASKEALFLAAVGRELDAALAEASRCLDADGAGLDRRVVLALDAWLGRYVGSMLASDIADMLDNPAVEIRDVVRGAQAAFYARLAAALAAGTAEEDRGRLGVTPEEIAGVMQTIAQGAKYLSRTREEFTARAAAATRLALAGLGAAPGTARG
jgi:TetR/AcrR family transcriptional regulator, regulator of autoinduction and epiphytic fitness